MPDTSRKSPLAIDDQLITIVKLARAAGFDDGAEWIEKRVMEATDRIIADLEKEACGHDYEHRWPEHRAPSPDAPRTDAVKGFGAGCSHCQSGLAFAANRGVAGVDAASVPSSCGCVNRLCRCHQLEMERVLAAFADAERKLAAKSAEVERTGAQCNLLHGKIATVERRLADAEKRAKEATYKGRSFNEWVEQAESYGRLVLIQNSRIAALTRKLAVAQSGLDKALDAGHCDTNNAGFHSDVPCAMDIVLKTLNAIAAIDAPAGEENGNRSRCADCSMQYGGVGWLDVTLPDDQWALIQPRETGGGILCANDIVRRASRLPGAEAVRAVIAFAPHDAPPPEPANAQNVPQRCKRCGWRDGMRPDSCDNKGEHDFEPVPESEWTLWQRQHIVGVNAQGSEAVPPLPLLARAAEDALIAFDKAVATMDEGGYMETLRSVLAQRAWKGE